MRKAALLFVLIVCGCTAVKEPATIKTPPSTQNDAPVRTSLSVETITAPPNLACDSNAAARKEVRVRHLHIEAFAEGHPGKEATPNELLDAYSKLEIARQDLMSGGSFDDAWKRYSDPRKAGPNPDGDLGFVKRGFLISEFDRVAFCIPQGEISPVFRTVFGFHVAQVTDIRY